MSNSTPDLDDDEYLNQMYLLASAVSVMPGAQAGMPNVTTPPPIRARWAAYLISFGVRIDTELATHKLATIGPKAGGKFTPQSRDAIRREDLWEMVKQQSPDMYEKMKAGEVTLEQVRENISDDVLGGVDQAVRQAAKEKAEREAEERKK